MKDKFGSMVRWLPIGSEQGSVNISGPSEATGASKSSMKTKEHKVKKIALAALVAGAMALPFGAPNAQETSTATASTQDTTGEEGMEWKNPERIADIQDNSERIRAYSVLIGQSVYDEMLKADAVADSHGLPEIESINIVDITEALTPDDVRSIEMAAETNADNIKRLQSYLDLQDDTRAKLEQEDVLPADVVGIQISQGGVLDMLVVPGWLTE